MRASHFAADTDMDYDSPSAFTESESGSDASAFRVSFKDSSQSLSPLETKATPSQGLSSVLAQTSAPELRRLLEMLAAECAAVRNVLSKELHIAPAARDPCLVQPPARTSSLRGRPKRLHKKRPSQIAIMTGWDDEDEQRTHPGTLEVFEFATSTLTMWTCCEADHDAEGCVAV